MSDPWKDIIGNARVVEALRRVASSASLGHAYIFSGPEGCGKRLAAMAFAQAVNCRCGSGGPDGEPCEACRLLATLAHPEVLVLSDANRPRWLKREDLMKRLGLEGPAASQRYAEAVLGIYEKGYLDEPLPRVEEAAVLDGFNIVTDHLFGKGSVPSKECYTPGPVSEAIRKSLDRGDISQAEFGLLRELYEQPLSMMPYRGTIHLAYVTARKDWKCTRPIQTFLSVRSILGGRKVVVIDDAEKMTAQAQNCLLKTLEEPPPDSILILVSSERRSLFPTIVSRCQVINFERLTRAEMDLASARLLGPGVARPELVAALSENCPGRLLEAAGQDAAAKLGAVRDLFTALAEGRVEAVFAFSGAAGRDVPMHRKKAQAGMRQALELIIFWITEIVRTQQGLAGRLRTPEFKEALRMQAGRLDEAGLIAASRVVERRLGLAALNVDMGLVVTTTLLEVAEALGAGAFGAPEAGARRSDN